jgi:deoxyribonuclease-4
VRKLRLGAHMSTAGGPANALLSGHSVGCDAIQMFVRNPNRWQAKDLTPEQIADFQQAREATGIDLVIAHGSYLINLGTPDSSLWGNSLDALIVELRRCRQLGIRDYVLHPGSHVGSGEEAGLFRVATGLSAALEATTAAPVTVLLETTGGQGSNLGYRFEHLGWLMHHAYPESRLGACFDTSHALAAGYEFRQPESYKAMWDRFDAEIGMQRLRVIHLNDSRHDLGSRADRHEHIGQGYVGLEAFRMLLNDEHLRDIPMLLETPKGPDLSHDVENLTLLRSLVEGEA